MVGSATTVAARVVESTIWAATIAMWTEGVRSAVIRVVHQRAERCGDTPRLATAGGLLKACKAGQNQV